jgi:hypothetical protein
MFKSIINIFPLFLYTSTPQYVFMAWCLVKCRENFTLPIPIVVYLFFRRIFFYLFHKYYCYFSLVSVFSKLDAKYPM